MDIFKRNGIIKAAIEEANKSTYHYKMGAVIFSGKRIISTGKNIPFSWSRKLHPKFKKWGTSIHAECNAILSARADLKGCDVLVVRINNSGTFGLAKPCICCINYLKYCKIKRCYYTINNDIFGVIKI